MKDPWKIPCMFLDTWGLSLEAGRARPEGNFLPSYPRHRKWPSLPSPPELWYVRLRRQGGKRDNIIILKPRRLRLPNWHKWKICNQMSGDNRARKSLIISRYHLLGFTKTMNPGFSRIFSSLAKCLKVKSVDRGSESHSESLLEDFLHCDVQSTWQLRDPCKHSATYTGGTLNLNCLNLKEICPCI